MNINNHDILITKELVMTKSGECGMDEIIPVSEDEKKYIAKLMLPVIRYNIIVFFCMPVVCSIAVPVLWLAQALFAALGFASILFLPAMYLLVKFINKSDLASQLKILLYSAIIIIGYGSMLARHMLTTEILLVQFGITVFVLIIFLPFIIVYGIQYRQIKHGKLTARKVSITDAVFIEYAGRVKKITVGRFLLSDFRMIAKKAPEVFAEMEERLRHNATVSIVLAIGQKGFIKHKNFLLKIDGLDVIERMNSKR